MNDSMTLLMVRNPAYEGMIITVQGERVCLSKVSTENIIESQLVISNGSEPTEDEVYDIIRAFRDKWIAAYTPDMWASL